MYKNVAGQKIVVYAHDTAADGPKTGDSANITIHLCKDGGTSASLGSPSELDSTNQKGKYILTLTQAQSNADLLSFSAYSTTSNIVLEGVEIYTVVELATDITTLVNSNLALSSARGSLVANGGEQVIYENAAPSADWIADTVAIDITQMYTDTSIAVKVYYKIKAGGAYVKFDTQNYTASQVNSLNEPGIVIRGIPNRYGYKVTLHQWAGSVYKSFDWERFSKG